MEKKETLKIEKENEIDKILNSNKWFNIAYTVLAFWLVLTPMMMSLVSIFQTTAFVFQICIVCFLFLFVKGIQLALNFRKIGKIKLNIFEYIMLSLFVLVILTLLFSGNKFEISVLQSFSYFVILLILCSVEKKYLRALGFTLIIEMAIDAVLGFIDINNTFVPGFKDGYCALSLQFGNPNYSAFIYVGVIMIALYYLINEKKLFNKIWLSACLVVFNLFMFINGSFVAETGLFLGELALLLYFWIKNKKCNYWLLGAFIFSVFASFVRIDGISTSSSCYLYEALSAIDCRLHTHFLKFFSGIFGKITGSGAIEFVAGSDGWNRGDLAKHTLDAFISTPRSIFFGNGLGYNNFMSRAHNMYLWILADCGIFAFLAFLGLLATLVVMFIKNKNKDKNIFLFVAFCTYLFMYIFGIVDNSIFMFISICAILYRRFKEDKINS